MKLIINILFYVSSANKIAQEKMVCACLSFILHPITLILTKNLSVILKPINQVENIGKNSWIGTFVILLKDRIKALGNIFLIKYIIKY